jgi:two-component system sensor histidine kinase YesM
MFRNNIRNKLFLLLFIATVLPTLSSITITYYYTKESLKTDSVEENERLLYQIKMNVAHYMDKLNEASLSVYNEPVKAPGLYSIIRYGGSDFSTYNEIYRSLQVLLRFDEDIYQVHLYSQNDNKSYLMANDVLKTVGEVRNPFNYNVISTGNGSVIVEPMHKSHSYGKLGLPYVSEKDVFSFHRKFYLQPDTIPLGVISFDVKLDFFSRLIGNMDNNNSKIMIVDGDGKVIYDPDQGLSGGGGGKPEWFSRMIGTGAENGNFEYSGNHADGILLYETIKSSYMDWYIVKQIPYAELYGNARTLTQINSFVLGLFLAIAVIITFVISTRFTDPIKELIRAINKVESGNLKARIDTARTDEFGILSKRFSQMIDTIDRLVVQEYQWKLANKINQLKALQAQIHPHFMNNALQSIATRALHQKQRGIYKLITSLGKMMDYHMDTGEETVPLSRELEHVGSYLELQQQRFDEKLKVDIEFDPDIRYAMIPKMIVQPLVENYFKHGIDPDKTGHVEIKCSRLPGDCIEILVKDNGTGMGEEAIARLQKKLDAAYDTGETLYHSGNIGLMNVYTRLKLFFGDEASMVIEQQRPSGLQIKIRVPLIIGEQSDSYYSGIMQGSSSYSGGLDNESINRGR